MRLTTLVTLICIMLYLQNGVHATDFLFVQTATGATLNGTLTLTGVAEDVTYFSDRPVRVAGIVSTEEFLTLYEPNGTFNEVRFLFSCARGSHTRALHVQRERERERERMRTYVSHVCACVRSCVFVCVCLCVYPFVGIQDPPNSALSCKVDGIATTTVLTITNPVVMTDESGVVALTYNAEPVSMIRGGPSPFDLSVVSSLEEVSNGGLMCDAGSAVRLFVDNAADPGECPSPMVDCPSYPVPTCCPSRDGCAPGWVIDNGPEPFSYCLETS